MVRWDECEGWSGGVVCGVSVIGCERGGLCAVPLPSGAVSGLSARVTGEL